MRNLDGFVVIAVNAWSSAREGLVGSAASVVVVLVVLVVAVDARSPARGLVPQPPHPPGTVAPRRGGASFGRRRDPLAGAGDGAEASASAHRRRARGGPGVDLPALGRVDDDGPCEGVVRVGVVGPTVVVPRSGDA